MTKKQIDDCKKAIEDKAVLPVLEAYFLGNMDYEAVKYAVKNHYMGNEPRMRPVLNALKAHR